ncbi:YajD family HNH nuclease [Thioalkalivibrio sp. ALJT]|uniref:YajD family HNH nuclease n=1 Tax=Thioalkalivibrio sp. ALJT TaxID=1158146 RepID=UPI000376FF42|nr:YajD family HNH nuclease [Thioalkalivibrio sp. ALJT]
MSESKSSRLDDLVARSRQDQAARERGYREQALKMYPWVCGRCGREFTRANLRELTVHHRDHNHDNNPPDGSNWELLCLYCHDNEHQRFTDAAPGRGTTHGSTATHSPFAGLAGLLKGDRDAGDDSSSS